MTHHDELWRAVQRSLSKSRWTRLSDLYSAVAKAVALDPREDFEPDAPSSSGERWKRNVRNVLQRRKGLGHVIWDNHARYRLP
jgi:hypothetical protein